MYLISYICSMKEDDAIRELMIQFDEKKLAKLHSAGELLEAKYGAEGTECRRKFEDDARSYYYGVILRDRRRELKMTQQQLADKIGSQRSYIARVERGQTDIQMSSFMRILYALNIDFELKMS